LAYCIYKSIVYIKETFWEIETNIRELGCEDLI
jgi:hypothetical protein